MCRFMSIRHAETINRRWKTFYVLDGLRAGLHQTRVGHIVRPQKTVGSNLRRRETPTRHRGNSVPLLVAPRLPKINVQMPPEKWEVVIAVTPSGQARCRNGYATFGTVVRFYPSLRYL